MIKSLKLFLRNFVNFNDRSTRSEYWFVQLWMFLYSFVMQVIISGSLVASGALDSATEQDLVANMPVFLIPIMLIVFVVSIAFAIGQLALTIRRLHDIGKSGFWVLFGLVPIVGTITILVFMCLESERNANNYGPYETFDQKQA